MTGSFVATMQNMNVAIVNPAFMLSFLGAPLLAGAAIVTSNSSARPWVIAGTAFAIGTHRHHRGRQHPAQQRAGLGQEASSNHRPRRRTRRLRIPVGQLEYRSRNDLDGVARLSRLGGAAVLARGSAKREPWAA